MTAKKGRTYQSISFSRSLSFSADEELKKFIDERAAALGMSRTQYVRKVIIDDLLRGGALVVQELPGLMRQPPRVGEKRPRNKGGKAKDGSKNNE